MANQYTYTDTEYGLTKNTITRVQVEGLNELKSAMLGLSRASAPGVRKALAAELVSIRNAMRANASANLTRRQKGQSDFTKGIKSYVFYRNKRDIGLDDVGGAAKAYGDFWIFHETGGVITSRGEKWLLIRNPKYAQRYFGGKRRNRMPIGTYVAALPHKEGDEMLGVFLPLKTKRILLAVLKKVVTLQVRLALTETGRQRSRNTARNIVNQITLGRTN